MKTGVRWAMAVGLTFVGGWLAFRGVDWHALGLALRRPAALAGLVIVPFVLSIEYFLRSLRWSLLVGGGRGMFPIIAASFFLNTVLPFRAGEAARVYFTHRRLGRPLAGCASALVADRLADALALLGLAAVFLSFRGGGHIFQSQFITLFMVLVLAGGGLATLIVWPTRWRRWLVPRGAPDRWGMLIDGFLTGLAPLRALRVALATAGLSVALWTLNACLFWFVSERFGLGISPVQAAGVLAAIALGVALPSTPGFLGVYEAAGLLILSTQGVGKEPALAFLLGFHGVQILGTTVWGWPALWAMAKENRTDFRPFSRIDKILPRS